MVGIASEKWIGYWCPAPFHAGGVKTGGGRGNKGQSVGAAASDTSGPCSYIYSSLRNGPPGPHLEADFVKSRGEGGAAGALLGRAGREPARRQHETRSRRNSVYWTERVGCLRERKIPMQQTSRQAPPM